VFGSTPPPRPQAIGDGVAELIREAASLDDAASVGRPRRHSADVVHLAARAMGEVVWDHDLVAGEILWVGATGPFLGRAPERIPLPAGVEYGPWLAAVHPDDRAAVLRARAAALEAGAEAWSQEYRFARADGAEAHVLERAFVARSADGRPVRTVGALRDVTRSRDAARATSRLAAIVASSNDAIVGKLLDGTVTSWNAAAERVFGYTEAEMVGASIYKLIPPELHEAERQLLAAISRGERVELTDAERLRKDGRRIRISLSVSPIRDASGTIVGASSIKRDITDRLRADEELRRREERYRALVAATAAVVWASDPEGAFVSSQETWEACTGQAPDEYAGFGWLSAIHADDREAVQAAWRRARQSGTGFESYGRLWSATHRAHRHFVARGVPVRAPDGSVREWIGTITDVEDHWRAEERLHRAERMESVGRLAGGIAHEANNQMTVILGAAEFLLRQLRDESARDDVEQIRRAAHRTAAITQQLLAYSRRQLLQPRLLNVNEVVTALAPVLERALGEAKRLVLHLADDLGAVRADPGQLDQVLLNLVLNARDAIDAGGTVTVETANVLLDTAYVAERGAEVAPGPYVMLSVSDTGHGMDEATLQQVFEPFFTTKGVGEGTGLGLSTVYGIVKQSGGHVWVYSEQRRGSVFKVYLPRVDAADPAAPLRRQAAGGGNEIVLVAEDQELVRAIIGRLLRDSGYVVLEARNGAEAMAVAEAAAAPPQLAIVDVVMPDVNGRDLAERLAARWPDLPVLFISGYTGFDAMSRGILEQGQAFMQKPLDPDELIRNVRTLLDAGRHGASDGAPRCQ
jgi:PAS domain S-box-containing protein